MSLARLAVWTSVVLVGDWMCASSAMTAPVTSPPRGVQGGPTGSRDGGAAPFARCAPPEGRTWSYDHLMCVRQVANARQLRKSARHRLVALGAGGVAHPWATLVLAHLTLDELRRQEAIAWYEQAAEAFARTQEAEGEVIARQNLANQFRLLGDVETAARHVARAVSVADASGQPLTIARAGVLEAIHAMSTGGDVGLAQRVLARADHLTPPTAPIGLRRTILFNLANVNLYLGHVEDALDALDRHRALRAEDHSTQNAATVELNRVVAQTIIASRQPTAAARARLVADAEVVAEEANRLRDPLVQAQTHKLLADLFSVTDPRRAAGHLERCLELERPLHLPRVRTPCLWSLAQLTSADDPGRAEQLSQQALSLIDESHDALFLAFAWQARLRLVWRTLPTSAAVVESLQAIDAIERLRLAQHDDGGRTALFARWADDYQWLTGRLFQLRPARLAQAFEVGERMRARVLIEQLAAGGVPHADTSKPLDARVFRRDAEAHRSLLPSGLSESAQRILSSQRHLLNLERADVARGRTPALSSDAVSWASLDVVQSSVDEHEAMIWFSIAPWTDLYGEFGGGSWALAITKHTATVHPLSVGADLDARIAAFTGLLRDRTVDQAAWSAAARGLGQTLLGGVLTDLPRGVTRLALVTDGPLHRFPFNVMPLEDGTALGDRFEISVAPSATVWLQLREAARRRVGGRVLVMADPDVPSGGSPDEGTPVGALPGARREARAIARTLSLPSHQVVDGPSASESFLKHAALDTVSLVHVAAHARANTAYPERSAIFLTPGDPREDGWLQPHEIAALNLRGAVVVLSACDSAEGSLIPGEGPLSLARAFFAGGASAVVATRWSLRDDDAAHVMEYFYRALSAGRSVAAALQDATRRAQHDGLPPAAWAGVVVLGDGGQVPVPAMPTRPIDALWTGTVALMAVCGWATWRRRRTIRRRRLTGGGHTTRSTRTRDCVSSGPRSRTSNSASVP